MCILWIFVMISLVGKSQDNNWTHFRGSRLNGISNVETVPVKWSDDSGFMWKTEIHGKGWSSPVIYGNQIWLTTASDDGKELFVMCLDFRTGKIIHDIKLFTLTDVAGKHSLNSYATPTPCIEKGFVYAHFGSSGTACINTASGAVVWTRTDLKCKHVQGPASSLYYIRTS
jgi:outer membrane protein assembly factor BamB